MVGIECLRYELGEPDESGRRRPIPQEGSDFTIDCGAVIAAIGVAKPSNIVTKPRWLTVEKASSALRSSRNNAIHAATSIVMRPTGVTIRNHTSAGEKTGHSRAIKNSPAFTMVAECR